MMNSGSCQCGEIQYTLDGDPLMTYACHCKDCQKRTGSAFSMGTIYALSGLSLSGSLSEWRRTSDDGNSNTRYSCSKCGNVIYGVSSNSPDLIKLQPGTLDETGDLLVDAHIWTRSAQRWVQLLPDALRYETQPDQLIEVFHAVLERRTAGQ